MRGWSKIKGAARYAGVSERTFRGWLKNGLPHSRLPSGTVLIRFASVNQWLEKFSVNENQVDAIVDEVMREFN